MDTEGWNEIQEYGKFLRETVNNAMPEEFGEQPPEQRRASSTSAETVHGTREEKYVSPFDWVSWRNFRLHSEFKHLAPLTSRENRIHAQQSSKLGDWITDPINDSMFRGWNGLGQVVYPEPLLEEEQREQEESAETEAVERILGEDDEEQQTGEQDSSGMEGVRTPSQQTSFARYLSQESPSSPKDSSRQPPRVTSIEPSRSSSMRSSDEDTRSIVSQDNHWRRTIFG